MPHLCRHCGTPLKHDVIGLGHQPPSNAYLTPEELSLPEVTYPLRVFVCTHCWLVQLPAHASAEELFTPDYAYFSSTFSSWCAHAERFVAAAVERLGLGPQSHVVELASNDGYLLQYLQQRGIPCLGIEPTHATAEAARAKGIDTIERFFGVALAAELETLEAYAGFQQRAEAAKHGLLEFLLQAKRQGRRVLGYGAAAKGNTLLNYAGIRADLLPAVADRSPSKQGKLLPGSHIPVISPEQLATEAADALLVLPWNLIEEVRQQLADIELVTAIPELRHWRGN